MTPIINANDLDPRGRVGFQRLGGDSNGVVPGHRVGGKRRGSVPVRLELELAVQLEAPFAGRRDIAASG